jgi:DNA polymerase
MARRPDVPGAQALVPEAPTLQTIAERMQDCRGCDLWADATPAVPGAGSARADLVLVGEQPGDQEDQAGQPFVGPAGRLLAQGLTDAGIDTARTFRTNAVHHFRWSGTRGKQRIHKSPSTWQVAACGPWMVAELDLVAPEGLVVLGATAGQALYGSKFRVGDVRGKRQDFPETLPGGQRVHRPPAWVVPTVHPSAVLRSRDRDADYAAFVADLRLAAALLD